MVKTSSSMIRLLPYNKFLGWNCLHMVSPTLNGLVYQIPKEKQQFYRGDPIHLDFLGISIQLLSSTL